MENTDKNLKVFSQVMWGVAEDFGGVLSENGLVMRFHALQEYTIEQISQAGTWLLKHREKSFPSVPTTKEFVDVIESRMTVSITPKSMANIEADKVLEKLKYQGRTGKADFEDKITQNLMVTRWPYKSWSSSLKTDDIKWWRKDFIEAYQSYYEKVKAEGMLLENSNQERIGKLEKLACGIIKNKEI